MAPAVAVIAPFAFAVLIALVLSMALDPRLLMRHIDILVPLLAHEVDRLAAGIIFAAVLFPILGMTGRYVQIDRFLDDMNRRRPDHDGLSINHLRPRCVPDVKAAVKARLADAYGHPDIGGVD